MGVCVDKVIDMSVAKNTRSNKTEQRVEFQQIVLNGSSSQQKTVLKAHLHSNVTFINKDHPRSLDTLTHSNN